MPYAIVPFSESLSFYVTHSIQFYFLRRFFCFSTFSFVPHSAHFDSHSITHSVFLWVCVDSKFSLWYVCTYDNLHTFIQAQAINSFKFLVSLIHYVCDLFPFLFCVISQTLILITRDMCVCAFCGSMFGSPFVILSCCCFFSISHGYGVGLFNGFKYILKNRCFLYFFRNVFPTFLSRFSTFMLVSEYVWMWIRWTVQ